MIGSTWSGTVLSDYLSVYPASSLGNRLSMVAASSEDGPELVAVDALGDGGAAMSEQLVEGCTRIMLVPPRRPVLPSVDPAPVVMLTATLGDDGRLLGGIVDSGYRGVVVEAFGGGHLPPSWLPDLDALVTRTPVVVASRSRAGEVLRRPYAFAGAETDLLTRGVVSAGLLDGPKARVLLALALGAGEPVGPTFAAHA